jgi:antitoxin ParD1/3/4
MDVTLNPELKKFIDDQVQQGNYESAADAINAAVARLQDDRDFESLPLDKLRAELDVGLAEADRGEFVDFTAEDIIAEGRAAWAAKHGKGE